MPNTIAPFGHPLYVMLKPVGAACNLRCEYCYYLEKQNLYDKAERHVMTEEMLERFTREYIEAQTMPQVLFTWHGGEPLMRPLSFYKKALELQRKYAHAGVMEYNGDVYSCDHFVFPEYKLGNIRSKSIAEMLYGDKQRQFSQLKHASLPRQCVECEFELPQVS